MSSPKYEWGDREWGCELFRDGVSIGRVERSIIPGEWWRFAYITPKKWGIADTLVEAKTALEKEVSK